LFCSQKAAAHPHILVKMKGEIVFAPDGSLTSVRYAWAFDESLSTSVAREVGDASLTREGLASLAQVNIDVLRESGYYTRVRADGEEQKFGAPEDYWLTFEEGVLTLRFTLPFKSAIKPACLELEIYDPGYFTDIKLADNSPVTMINAPSQCKLLLDRQNWTQIANKIVLTCP